MLSGIYILKRKFILTRKIKNEQLLRFLESFWLLFVFFITFCPEKVCKIQNKISSYINDVQFLTQGNQK